ncbi:hypothetical protein PsorP6_013008 [Peronosclerospora sorghi]|uniref:Uncharacterized protein n=1 Tax=Peronosclerospora sorghi TaxID=230839 RepID=A0ACC0WIT9_9STRA|nr:hypothetical protein PsorP6_013008 [Peronosclerospora sorghi]
MGLASALSLPQQPFVRGFLEYCEWNSHKSGVGIASMGVMRPELAMRNIVPVFMAGVLGVYGLIVAVIIMGSIDPPNGNAAMYGSYFGFAHLAAGLCCGLSG